MQWMMEPLALLLKLMHWKIELPQTTIVRALLKKQRL